MVGDVVLIIILLNAFLILCHFRYGHTKKEVLKALLHIGNTKNIVYHGSDVVDLDAEARAVKV